MATTHSKLPSTTQRRSSRHVAGVCRPGSAKRCQLMSKAPPIASKPRRPLQYEPIVADVAREIPAATKKSVMAKSQTRVSGAVTRACMVNLYRKGCVAKRTTQPHVRVYVTVRRGSDGTGRGGRQGAPTSRSNAHLQIPTKLAEWLSSRPSLACREVACYTLPYGKVCAEPPRCLVRRALGCHPTRRSGAARAFRRFDYGSCPEVPHHPRRHDEARRRFGAGRARDHGEG